MSCTDAAPDPSLGREILVDCQGVSRTFGSGDRAVVAIHGATCSVAPGARLALVGPSGSGKSTLVHLLAGLDRPTAGTLSWPGLAASPRERQAQIGVVFQAPSLLPALSVAENVALPMLFSGADPADAVESARAALTALWIADLGPRLPEELSGGQAQRVAVARVLAAGPRLILADEPTGALDQESGGRVISVLLEAADRLDAALVVSTHDQSVAARLTETWVVRDGRLDTTPMTRAGWRT